jgi:hypothetical protein
MFACMAPRSRSLTPGVGAPTVESLAIVAEVVHGAPHRFADPARFSLAHGGKDRPPVPLKVYDETIRVLKPAVQKAKLGHSEELQALRRLDDQARLLERTATGPSLEVFIAGERNRSAALDGRSVFGWERASAKQTGEEPNGNAGVRWLKGVTYGKPQSTACRPTQQSGEGSR